MIIIILYVFNGICDICKISLLNVHIKYQMEKYLIKLEGVTNFVLKSYLLIYNLFIF